MKQFFQWYALLGKAQLKRVETYIAVAALLVISIIMSIVKLPQQTNCRVGIYCESREMALEFIQVMHTEKTFYALEPVESLSDLKDGIKRGTYECGFALKPDYKEIFASGSQAQVCDYYCGSFTTKGEVAKESVYISLMKIQSAIYLDVSLEELYENPTEELRAELQKRQDAYLAGDELLDIEEVYVETDQAFDIAESSAYPVQGTIAFLLFLMIYLLVGELRAKERAGYSVILMRGEKLGFALAKTFAFITLPALVGLVLIYCMGENVRVFAELPLLLVFIIYSFFWCYLLSGLLRKEARYMTALVPSLLLTIIVSPIYVEAANYFGVVKYLRLLFPTGFYLFW